MSPGSLSTERWAAALIAVGAVSAAVVVAMRGDPAPSAEQSAQDRCRADVLKRLVSPGSASLTDIRVESGTLDIEGRDYFPVTVDDPLKGVDVSRITVLNVSGVVDAPTAVGSTIRDRFDCRAYLVDGALADTLVVMNPSD